MGVLVSYAARLSNAVRALTAALVFRGHFGSGTLTGNVTLTYAASQFLRFTVTASDVDVTLPTAADGRCFVIRSTTASTKEITIKNPAGTALIVLRGGEECVVGCEDTTWALYAAEPVIKRHGFQTVDMADAALALVYGTAGAGEAQVTAPVLLVDPNSGGAAEDLTLPPVATSEGVELVIYNTGGEGIVVKAVGGSTVVTLDTAQHARVFCDGTTWRGMIGGVT